MRNDPSPARVTVMQRTLRALGTYGVAMRAQLVNRASFILQISFMLLNDLVWLAFWLLVFANAPTIRGWQQDEFLVLFSITSVSAGLAFGACAGIRDSGRVIYSGELDALLVQPTPVLARMLVRRADIPLMGDILFGVGLFALSGHGDSPLAWLAWTAAALASALCMLSFLTAAWASAFVLAGRQELAQLAGNSALVFTMYPISIFGPAMKLVMFTVIPVAFMGAVPTSIVLDFNVAKLAGLYAIAITFAFIAIIAYNAGLRRFQRAS